MEKLKASVKRKVGRAKTTCRQSTIAEAQTKGKKRERIAVPMLPPYANKEDDEGHLL